VRTDGWGKAQPPLAVRGLCLVLTILILSTSACGRAASPVPSAPAPLPHPAASTGSAILPQAPRPWVERPYNFESDRVLRCLGGATRSLRIRTSPSGEWSVHPTNDGRGSICLVNNRTGQHKILFDLIAAMAELELQGASFAEQPGLGAYFWSGDGDGVYLYYPGTFFYFVTVPAAVASRIEARAFFFHAENPARQLQVLGSPTGTRNLVVLETLREEIGGGAPRCRLCIVDPSGVELACLDEFWGYPGTAEATARAVLVAVDERAVEGGPWHYVYGQARVYHLSLEGTWVRLVYAHAANPHLRADSLTVIAPNRGRLWVKELTPAGLQVFLFPVPEALLGLRSAGLCRWDDTGQYMFFGDVNLLVQLKERPNEVKWPWSKATGAGDSWAGVGRGGHVAAGGLTLGPRG